MSEKPNVPATSPAVLKLEPGTYWWCSCGNSQGQPWCDGSHKGSSFTPVKVEVDEPKTLALCLCKHSSSPSLCDGSHASI